MAALSERLSDQEALGLYRAASLHELGGAAHAACRARHPETFRTYAIDRNINYTNVCASRCSFCAFHVGPDSARGRVITREELLGKIAELAEAGGTHVLLQGGLNPHLKFAFHAEMLGEIRSAFPGIHIHGFSPPEVWFFHELYGLPVREVLGRLRAAGLDSVPGGGAEILVDAVRRRISPRKCTTGQWLSVMRDAHALGMPTTATMMFGHVETDAHRIEHLRRLRELQDESLDGGRGHFTAFICWTFQPANTELARQGRSAGGDERRAARWPVGACAYLRTLAIARLYLDNFDNLQASWVTQGDKIGQLALLYGANDLGGVMMEENVVAAAGTSYRLPAEQLRRLIRDAGYEPRQRNCRYQLVD